MLEIDSRIVRYVGNWPFGENMMADLLPEDRLTQLYNAFKACGKAVTEFLEGQLFIRQDINLSEAGKAKKVKDLANKLLQRFSNLENILRAGERETEQISHRLENQAREKYFSEPNMAGRQEALVQWFCGLEKSAQHEAIKHAFATTDKEFLGALLAGNRTRMAIAARMLDDKFRQRIEDNLQKALDPSAVKRRDALKVACEVLADAIEKAQQHILSESGEIPDPRDRFIRV